MKLGSIVLAGVLGLYPTTNGWPEEKKPVPQVAQATQVAQAAGAVTTAAMPQYKPPLRGAPGGRVGGGTRGSMRDVFVLSALAPDHTGLTVSDQPSLYWYISSATALPVELAIIDAEGVKPLVETRLASPERGGVYRVSLADLGVRLEPGVQYRWSVTVIPDARRRSRDILAAATIERAELPEVLRAKVAETPKAELPLVYAEAGFWYDALAVVSDLLAAAPGDSGLRQQRAALLTQVGLPDVEAGAR